MITTGTRLRTITDKNNAKFVKKYPIGLKIGRLTVTGHKIVELSEKSRSGHRYCRKIVCRCDCGKTTTIRASSLTGGNTTSCGCVAASRRVEAAMKAWKLPYGQAAFNVVYGGIKKVANDRKIKFDLTPEEARRIVTSKCYYCGIDPCQTRKCLARLNGNFVYNGVDRLDSSVGYNPTNCVPCCKTCNYAKRTMTVDEFKSWIWRVASCFLGMTPGIVLSSSSQQHT